MINVVSHGTSFVTGYITTDLSFICLTLLLVFGLIPPPSPPTYIVHLLTTLFRLIGVDFHLQLHVAITLLQEYHFHPNNISSLYVHQRTWYNLVGKK